MIATVLLWIALILGIAPTAWYLVQFRPSWPRSWPPAEERWAAWTIWVMVAAVLLGYLRIAAVLALRGGVSRPEGWADATASILPLLIIDAAAIPLLRLARKYRAEWTARKQERQTHD